MTNQNVCAGFFNHFRLTPQGLSVGLTLMAVLQIVSTSYVGLNGGHVWRQADSYSQILGFLGRRGLNPLEDFYGHKTFYDFPLYQFIVATMARLAHADPLVVSRFFNAVLWVTLMLGAYRLAEAIKKGSGNVVLFLLCTSPLFIHYYSTPLPDTLSLSLAVNGVAAFLTGGNFWLGLLSIILSTMIKSPIPFVLLATFIAIWLAGLSRPGLDYGRLVAILTLAAVAAIGEEQLRNLVYRNSGSMFAQDPHWYFGSVDLRLSREFWSTMWDRLITSFPFVWIAWLLIAAITLSLWIDGRRASRIHAPLAFGFFSGWLVFSNVYFIHDYYELPVSLLAFMMAGTALSVLSESSFRAIRYSRIYKAISPHANMMALILALGLVVYMPRISALTIASPYDGIRYLLRDVDQVVWVNNEASDLPFDGVPIGGLIRTRVVKIKNADLDADCETLMHRYRAFLVKGSPSSCVLKHQADAKAFINDSGLLFLLK